MIFYYQYFLIHLKFYRSSKDHPGKEVDSRLQQALFERAGFARCQAGGGRSLFRLTRREKDYLTTKKVPGLPCGIGRSRLECSKMSQFRLAAS
jgi:hypothetical protein